MTIMTFGGAAQIRFETDQSTYGCQLVSKDGLQIDSLASYHHSEKPPRYAASLYLSAHDSPAEAIRAFAQRLAEYPAEKQWDALLRFESGHYTSLHNAMEDRIRHYLGPISKAMTLNDLIGLGTECYEDTPKLVKTHVPTVSWAGEKQGSRVTLEEGGVIPEGMYVCVCWERNDNNGDTVD